MDGMFEPRQLRQLHALGITPLRLRAAADDAMPQAPADGQEVTAAPAIALYLWLPPREADPFHGPHEPLLRQLLCSLGLAPEQALLGVPEEGDARPVLAFGPGGPSGAVQLPALAKLRDPLEKRIAWPALRTLRRRLWQASP